MIRPLSLYQFVKESNHIEGIDREPRIYEVEAHESLLARPALTVAALIEFVHIVAGAPIRKSIGMNVYVGNHVPPPGGPDIVDALDLLLKHISANVLNPWEAHCRYETLHPFIDCNGRSGRAVWLWHMRKNGESGLELSPLHEFYYQALDAYRRT